MTDQISAPAGSGLDVTPADAGLELAPDAVRLVSGDPLFAEEEYPDPPADGDSDQVSVDEGGQ